MTCYVYGFLPGITLILVTCFAGPGTTCSFCSSGYYDVEFTSRRAPAELVCSDCFVFRFFGFLSWTYGLALRRGEF